jgi:hypothetical protein
VPTLNPPVLEKAAFVKSNLSNRCLYFETCIPSAPLRAVEATSKRTGMGESGVYNVRFWHTDQQLSEANRAGAALLDDLPLVGRCVKLTKVGEDFSG